VCASRSLAWIQFQNERDDARTAFCTDTTREESAQNERSRARDRAFSLFVCATIVKKTSTKSHSTRIASTIQHSQGRKRNARSRFENAERRKAHNDAADDDEKEEEEKKGEKESRKARREKIPP
jgi:hypothetical protein